MLQVPDGSKSLRYVVYGVLLWIFVDLGTAGGFRLAYFTEHGPLLLAFYIGYPLIFRYLIFRRGWEGWKLFGATAAAIMIIEGWFTRNPFVLSFPLLLIGIPLALCIYAPLTYFPLWIVNREMGKHKTAVALLSGVILVIMWLTTVGRHE